MTKGKLFIVPTPIGNLKDITLRAIDTLKQVDFIYCEDTRQSKKLLSHYHIDKPVYSFHKFNEHKKLLEVINLLKSGKNIGLVSDAGTPGISDPGYLLVHESVKNDIEVITLPGSTAFVPALINSGLPTDRFVFEGFLPEKKGRKKRLQQLSQEERTIVLYVSPHKILKTLKDLISFFEPDRMVSLSREISKIYEQTIRSSLKELLQYAEQNTIRGELVLVIEGYKDYQKRIKRE